jgi:arsenate reductase
MKTILFACVHNAGRSQMAAAFFNAAVPSGSARAISAGTRPAPHVHPEVVEVMREVGLDLSQATPRLLTGQLANEVDLLVTMGCGETCAGVAAVRRLDWPLSDPRGQTLQAIREIRDEVRARVKLLLIAEFL